jgi:hypothetical protein
MRYGEASAERLAKRPDSAARFGRICATLGFDDPSFFAERNEAVLSVIERACAMTAAEMAVLTAAQSEHMAFQAHRTVLSTTWKSAHQRLLGEARAAGRLALVGRASETSYRLMRALGHQHGRTSRVAGCALAGELLWALIADIEPSRVLRPGDERVLRGAWQTMLCGAPAIARSGAPVAERRRA